MIRVALTGGIGTGKSGVLARFAARGLPTIDADRLARVALAPGAPAVDRVVARFGPDVLDADGRIDRRRLAALVFADGAARRDLEALIHPEVIAAIEDWFAGQAAAGAVLGIADIPLLFETGLESRFHRVVVAACEPAEQVHRIMTRDGLSESEAQARLAAQWPIAQKVARADYVIRTDGSFEETDRQVAAVVCSLMTCQQPDPEPPPADRGRSRGCSG